MNRSFFALFLMLCFLVMPFVSEAWAQRAGSRAGGQEQIITDITAVRPAPNPIPDSIEILSFPKMSFGEGNRYFTDITTVQYQISLLNVLVERQRRNKEIQDAMNNVGIVYKEPAPAKSICWELPYNALCAKFYPELYAGLHFATAPVLPKVQEKSFQEVINQRTLPDRPVTETKKEEKKKTTTTPYLWTDITCVFETCRAVLVPSGGGARMTVRVGDRVGSNFMVQSIDSRTINLQDKNGRTITLKPAPSPAQGGSASPLLAASAGQALPQSSPIADLGLEDILEELEFINDEIVLVD